MLATLLVPALILPALINAVPLQPRSPLLDAVSIDAGAQDISSISTSCSTRGSNDGLALIARSLFNSFQGPPNDSTPSTNNEAPAPGNAQSASVAPDIEEAEPIALSSTVATTTTQGESQPSVAALSAVDIPQPSSNPSKGSEQNGYRFSDW